MQNESETTASLLKQIAGMPLADGAIYLLLLLFVIAIFSAMFYCLGARSRNKPERSLLVEMLSDDNDALSSGRVIAVIGLLTGVIVILAQAFGLGCDRDFQWALSILFGGAYGAKTFAKKFEKGSNSP